MKFMRQKKKRIKKKACERKIKEERKKREREREGEVILYILFFSCAQHL